MRRVLFVTLLGMAWSAAAQVPPTGPSPSSLLGAAGSQLPPTKKDPNGYCIAPGTPHYKDVREFIPFVKLEDCLKSGGRLPPKR